MDNYKIIFQRILLRFK